jgi:N6-adenosine-specific RNA methylase IME4
VTINRKDIAKSSKVSEWKVRQAIEVKKANPQLAAKITSGEVKLADAVREVKKDKYEERVKEAAEKPKPVKQEGPFDLVLADPPWQYDFAETKSREVENQYRTATVDEIKGHSPSSAKDCVLLLWATAPKLIEALEVMESWGFEYKTHAVWDKGKIGMGYWFRGRHELLLVGTRGKASPPAEQARVGSIFSEDRTGHSRKPECVYSWVEKAFPGLSRLEMYCRSPRKGWACWGNES